MHERKSQCARLEADDVIGAHELEALTERAAMFLDGQPESWIRRIVDHHDAFEILVVEPGDRIERLFEHLRRLVMGRNMN